VTLALEHLGNIPPPVIFFSVALSMVPIAKLIVEARRTNLNQNR